MQEITKSELQRVQNAIDTLIDAGEITSEKREQLNALGTQVYEYEEENVLIPDLYGVEFLKVLLEELECDHKELISIFEAESILIEILNGQRELTVKHIERLANLFRISPSAFFSC